MTPSFTGAHELTRMGTSMTSVAEILKQYLEDGGGLPHIQIEDEALYPTDQAGRILKKQPATWAGCEIERDKQLWLNKNELASPVR